MTKEFFSTLTQPTELDSVCLTYRHDFGLLSDEEKDNVRSQAKHWINAIAKEYQYQQDSKCSASGSV